MAKRPFNPYAEPKKTYYQNRGKVHLVRHDEGQPAEIAERAWCGVSVENCNHYTSKEKECTCQKCLMVMTGTWRKKHAAK